MMTRFLDPHFSRHTPVTGSRSGPATRSFGRGPTPRRLVAIAAAAGVGIIGQIFVAPTAQAGTLGLTAEIQGAGRVYSVDAGSPPGTRYDCTSDQQDDRVVSSCPRKTFENAFEAWVWLEATPASSPTGNWRFAGWSGCDETRTGFNGKVQCGVHSGAFSLDERRPRARFEDVQAPSISAVNATQSSTSERTFSFTFSSDDPLARYSCRLDAEPYSPCSSGVSRTMTEGSHTFQVVAYDPSDNQRMAASAPVTAVDTAITGGPTGLVNSRTATFDYTTAAGISFECSLDGGMWAPCGNGSTSTATYPGLADGAHQFRVRAKNGQWIDNLPATRGWTIDATPPETSLGTPDTSGRDASFGFSGFLGASGFQCQLSGPSSAHSWQPCTTPRSYSSLGDGTYTFEVRAVDAAGNVDPTAASHTWAIDLTAPETTFGSTPAHGSWVLSRSATLTLGGTEGASTFTCTLDGAGRTCGPTRLQLTDLSSGTHVATAAASDTAGNIDTTPASRTWTVPFDDTQLSRTKAWTKKTANSVYLGTYSTATLKGATLTKKVTNATKIALVATKAPGHGTVKVFLGSTLLKKVSLATSTVKNKQVIPVATFGAAQPGTVKIVVATAGKQVRIDGLGIATG